MKYPKNLITFIYLELSLLDVKFKSNFLKHRNNLVFTKKTEHYELLKEACNNISEYIKIKKINNLIVIKYLKHEKNKNDASNNFRCNSEI